MKNVLCLLIGVISWSAVKAMTEEDVLGILEGFSDKCESKPSEEDMRNIIRNEENVPPSTKCFRLCLMNQLEMLNDCKLDIEKCNQLMAMVFDDKEEEVTEIMNNCNSKVTCEDKCEAAHNFAMCILAEFKARGWKLPEVEKDR